MRPKESNGPAARLPEADPQALPGLPEPPLGDLAACRQELEQTRREFASFAYSVSHDLRAPIRAIEGFSKILLAENLGRMNEDAQRFLQHIVANTRLLSSQIEDLLRYQRTTRTPPRIVDCEAAAVLREAMAVLRPSVPILVQGELPRVKADPNLLREIFLELLGNALKATRAVAEPRIEVGSTPCTHAAIIFVRDNGLGFSAKYAGSLFEVFQKLHPPADFPGNGIGLAIARQFVRMQGGWIRGEPGVAGGAIFSFALPPASHGSPAGAGG